MTELFRVSRSGSAVGFNVANGQSARLPGGFFGAPAYGQVDPTGKFTAPEEGDYEFEFAFESAWAAATWGAAEATGEGFWVLWRNGVEDSGPISSGDRIRLHLNAGEVVQPAPYAAGIKGTTSGNPAAVTIAAIGGLAHWAGRAV